MTKTPMELAENGEVTWPRVRGISRLADAGRVLGISFDRRPTDDEMRAIHDFLRDPNATLRQSARRDALLRRWMERKKLRADCCKIRYLKIQSAN